MKSIRKVDLYKDEIMSCNDLEELHFILFKDSNLKNVVKTTCNDMLRGLYTKVSVLTGYEKSILEALKKRWLQ